VVVGAGSLAGNESEKEIAERVDAFVKSMPLSAPAVRGLMVEIKEPLDGSRPVGVRAGPSGAGRKGQQRRLAAGICFSAGVVGRHGDLVKRLATYSDLLGTTYSEGWREDASWIAEQALNKPVILKLDAGHIRDPSPFLTAMLAASGTSVEIVWSEPPDAKAAAAVCTEQLHDAFHHQATCSRGIPQPRRSVSRWMAWGTTSTAGSAAGPRMW
jgi:hypothetical protein